MSYGDATGSRYAHGNQFQHVHVSGKAHLGNTYHVGLDNPLDRLPYAENALFNSYSKQHEPTCLHNTRVDLLREIHDWADGQDERHIFWLNGLAGTGKSTIARTVARRHFEEQRLGASFFFDRGGGDVSHAGRFVTTIAVQLAYNIPASRQHICNAVVERTDIASQSLRDQWHHLVLRPLSKLEDSSCKTSYVLVVDALDECDDNNNIQIIVQLLADTRSLERVRLRVFLTSRPEVPIRCGFCHIPDAEHQDLVLHNISPSIIDQDIKMFLEYNLELIQQEFGLSADWLGKDVVVRLTQSASGLFIWAATACRFVHEGGLFAADRLCIILKDNPCIDHSPTDTSSFEESSDDSDDSSMILPEKQLDRIYLTVLQSLIRKYKKQERKKWYKLLRDTLGAIVLLFSPLSVLSLERLLQISRGNMNWSLYELHSILNIPQDPTCLLRLHHPSFRDFLLDKNRCSDPNLSVDDRQAHGTLATKCIQLMSNSLKQDICGLEAPGARAADVKRAHIDQSLPPELQYACLYWVQHLQKSDAQLSDNDHVHMFLKEHFLHWLEALSWMQKISEGIYAINALHAIALIRPCPYFCAFVHDMKRFALYSRSGIEGAPLQLYCSALVFAPVSSIVRKQFTNTTPRWIRKLPEVDKYWNALLQTLEGHSESVQALVFSPYGRFLASGSHDKKVNLWDAGTGELLKILYHEGSVRAVVFSPDGKVLASGSDDRTVKLWDAGTGALIQTLYHKRSVQAVIFSPEGKLLASGSDDSTVKLWDASTGVLLKTLYNEDPVKAVIFSPDGKVLASGSLAGTVKLWDVGTCVVLKTVHYEDLALNVVFSPDSKLLASGSINSTVKLWDAGTGALLQTLHHEDSVWAIVFSPDNQVLASASKNTVMLWEASSGALLQKLKSHSNHVHVLAFSSDSQVLASASGHPVMLWETSRGALVQTTTSHPDAVGAVAFSTDSKVLASVSLDRTLKLWESSSGALLQTFKGDSKPVLDVAFSPDSRVLASATQDKTVELWETSSGTFLHTFKDHSVQVNAVAFSPDGKVLAAVSFHGTVKLWDTDTYAVLHTLNVNHHFVTSLSFSHDGTLLMADEEILQTTLPSCKSLLERNVSSEIRVEKKWVTYRGKNMLWLPSEYWPICSAVRGNFVALGYQSGHLSILEFAF